MNDKQKKKIVNFLNAKPQDKIHRYKRRKVKKVWVYAAIITTMIGLESISSNVNTLSGLSSITVHADTVVNYKQQYYPPILIVESGSTAQTDGSNSYLNLLYEINGKEASDVDYIEFQLNNGTNSTKSNPKAKIIGETSKISGQPTVKLRVDFSGDEAFGNERAFADGNTVIHFIDGTSLVINPNRNEIFLFSKQDVESNRRGIMRLSNFTEEEKNKTFEKSISIVEKGYIDDMKSLSEVTDFDSLSDVNSLYKKTIEAKLEQASEDFTNQDSGFKQFEDEVKSKKAEINAVTDAKKGAKEKALKEVDSLLSQYRKSTFDATGKDVLSQITEGVAKIKAVSVEREKPFDKDAHKPTVNQPTEGEQVVSGKGVGGDKITIKDKDNKVIGTGTVAEDGTFTVKTNRPLEKGEELTVTPTTDGKEGTPGTTTVAEKPFDKDAHKPTVNQPTEGEQVVSGKGVGGDKITIKDKDNKVIGKGTVAEDGTFTVKTDRPLEKGEELTVIPTTDGKEGTPGTTTVAEKPFDKDAHKPTVNQPIEGEQKVSGKGVGGDKITIKDKDNKVIGKGTVGKQKLPSTGEYDNKSLLSTGLLLLTLAGGLLGWKLKRNK